MTLTKIPKVGDKVRYLGGMYDNHIHRITEGETYEIIGRDSDGFTYFHAEDGDRWFIAENSLIYYELVVSEPTPVEASPTVIELLANISRRLYEAEKEITELNEKQAIFFDIDKLMKIRIFDLERQNRVQAYEINELYREVAERG